MAKKTGEAYHRIIEKIFFDHFESDIKEFEFVRREIVAAKEELAPDLDLNPGDVPYRFRYRAPLPDSILDTQPKGLEWIIEGAGRSIYRFRLVPITRIYPNPSLATISVPDATPEIIRAHALDDEQALLAILRYNRLIDTFLSLTTYSLQNHLRTSVEGIGQIEIDELYIGLDKWGCHYVIPVQAKSGTDQIGVVQTTQDIKFSENRFPGMKCRALSAQFMDNQTVALFELALQDDQVVVVEEKHYKLVPASDLDQKAIRNYRTD